MMAFSNERFILGLESLSLSLSLQSASLFWIEDVIRTGPEPHRFFFLLPLHVMAYEKNIREGIAAPATTAGIFI